MVGRGCGAPLVHEVVEGGAVHTDGTVRRGDTLVEVDGQRVRSVDEAERALRCAPSDVLLGVRRPWDAPLVLAWLRSLAPASAGWERVVQRFASASPRIDGPALAALRNPQLTQLCANEADRPCLGHVLRLTTALATGGGRLKTKV